MNEDQPNPGIPTPPPREAMTWEEINGLVAKNLQVIAEQSKHPQQTYEAQMSLIYAAFNELLYTLSQHYPTKRIILNG